MVKQNQKADSHREARNNAPKNHSFKESSEGPELTDIIKNEDEMQDTSSSTEDMRLDKISTSEEWESPEGTSSRDSAGPVVLLAGLGRGQEVGPGTDDEHEPVEDPIGIDKKSIDELQVEILRFNLKRQKEMHELEKKHMKERHKLEMDILELRKRRLVQEIGKSKSMIVRVKKVQENGSLGIH